MSRSGPILSACAVVGLLAAIVGAQPASRPAAEPEKLTVTVKEVLVDRNACVEDKAFALPLILSSIDFRQIIQDTALQVIDLIEAEFEHKRRRFLATYASRAEHR